MPVERAVIQRCGERGGFGVLVGVDGGCGGLVELGEVEELLQEGGIALAPFEEVRELGGAVLDGAADRGVLGVGLGGHREDVVVAEIGVVVGKRQGEVCADDG